MDVPFVPAGFTPDCTDCDLFATAVASTYCSLSCYLGAGDVCHLIDDANITSVEVAPGQSFATQVEPTLVTNKIPITTVGVYDRR